MRTNAHAVIRISVVLAVMLGCWLMTGCEGEPNALNPCPYSGGGSDCDAAAETTNGSGGLCDGQTSVSAYSLAQDCEAWDSGFKGCWIACVNSAGSCSEAQDCQDECYYCGR